jgi:hypothetical protein
LNIGCHVYELKKCPGKAVLVVMNPLWPQDNPGLRIILSGLSWLQDNNPLRIILASG